MARGYKDILSHYTNKMFNGACSRGLENVEKITSKWQEGGYLCERDYILANTSSLGSVGNCSGAVDISFWDIITLQATKGFIGDRAFQDNMSNIKKIDNIKEVTVSKYCFGCGAVINRTKYKCDYCGSVY